MAVLSQPVKQCMIDGSTADEEMDFVDLLLQFDLHLSGMTDALRVDLATLQSTGHNQLPRLLTDNAR